MSVCQRSPGRARSKRRGGAGLRRRLTGITAAGEPRRLADAPHAPRTHLHPREARQELAHLDQPEVGEAPVHRHHLVAHRRRQGRPPTPPGRRRAHALEPLRTLRRVLAQPRPASRGLTSHCLANAACVSPTCGTPPPPRAAARACSASPPPVPPRGAPRIAAVLTLRAGPRPPRRLPRSHRKASRRLRDDPTLPPAPPAEAEVVFWHPTETPSS